MADIMDRAVAAALQGTADTNKRLKILGHEFKIKKASIKRVGNLLIVEGLHGKDTIGGRKSSDGKDHQISHHLTWRPDDQVGYVITKENGVIKNIEVAIKRGGWTPIIAPIGAVISAYYGKPIPAEKIKEVGQQIGKVIDGSWESAAHAIIANIALRAK